MPFNDPLTSIVIPVYNSSDFIEATIKSVLQQTYQNFEIIVIDDASTDSTVQKVKALQKLDARISLVETEHSGRPAIPRNIGWKRAKGQLVAFLDSDDLWVTDKLEIQIEFYKKHPELSFIYSMSKTFGDIGFFSPNYEVLPLLHKSAETFSELVRKGNPVTCSSVVVSKSMLERTGGFDEDPEMKVEDYALWLQLARIANIGFIPRIHVYYRVHSSQFSGSAETKKSNLDYLRKKLNVEIPNYKFAGRRNHLTRILRNSVHFFTYIYVRLSGVIEKRLKTRFYV